MPLLWRAEEAAGSTTTVVVEVEFVAVNVFVDARCLPAADTDCSSGGTAEDQA